MNPAHLLVPQKYNQLWNVVCADYQSACFCEEKLLREIARIPHDIIKPPDHRVQQIKAETGVTMLTVMFFLLLFLPL